MIYWFTELIYWNLWTKFSFIYHFIDLFHLIHHLHCDCVSVSLSTPTIAHPYNCPSRQLAIKNDNNLLSMKNWNFKSRFCIYFPCEWKREMNEWLLFISNLISVFTGHSYSFGKKISKMNCEGVDELSRCFLLSMFMMVVLLIFIFMNGIQSGIFSFVNFVFQMTNDRSTWQQEPFQEFQLTSKFIHILTS